MHIRWRGLIYGRFGDNVGCSSRSKIERKNARGKKIYGVRAKPYNSVCVQLPCIVGRKFTQTIITYHKLQITLNSVNSSDYEMRFTHVSSEAIHLRRVVNK